ncbi:exo-beta-N-acetylmuramidase NamZ family protein [Antarcticibacterium arcticum]|nr:DUF1343 domain-containing protein [Antarcticibacterium arcticum]
MFYKFFKNTFLFFLITMVSCGRTTGQNGGSVAQNTPEVQDHKPVVVGANRIDTYLPQLKGKRIALVGNQSSVIFKMNEEGAYTHLVDSLLSRDVNLVKVFAPEHGFRGTADAGETIKDGKDASTGLPVVSLYGDNKKPKASQLKDVDLVIFDLQDVGTRFYTYISSLHYVMEACAENNIPLLVLDRPNPNGHYVDGPLLNTAHTSFVGMHPIPVVHGLTMGEYAQMINGEKWLKNGIQCELKVISMENYDHQIQYSLPIKPSPNLPNDQAINLYPSLCFFEGTNVNEGRGTPNQFQVFGSPFLNKEYFDYTYTPVSMEGAKSPKHLNTLCYGRNLTEQPRLNRINLEWLIEAYENTQDKSKFFNSFFTKLAGNTQLQKQIEAGLSEKEIRETWVENLETFKEKRKEYLLY